MAQRSRTFSTLMMILATGGLVACNNGQVNKATPSSIDPIESACVEADKCCKAEELRCEGNPDGVVICTCDALWNCSRNPDKCEKPLPVPGGGGEWDCSWSELSYTCKAKGDKDSPPAGGGDWTCNYDEQANEWVCSEPPPNPTNINGNGDWRCEVKGGTLVCYPNEPPEKPPVDNPPDGPGEWKCETNADGNKVCKKEDGYPEGGGDWQCHLMLETNTWVCVGKDVPSDSNPTGKGGWDCTRTQQNGESVWVCKKSNDEDSEYPEGGGDWACMMDSEFGIVCEETPEPPEPPVIYPEDGGKCIPGTKRWCDGMEYCGWGQMTCKPDGTWPTKVLSNGRRVYDCHELASGARPNTQCACYFFYYNGACCERPDCIIPDDYTPQICPESNGGLCDYCNPQKPECKTPGARCVLMKSGESFCSQECSQTRECPDGYRCAGVDTKQGKVYQCIPPDLSCYF